MGMSTHIEGFVEPTETWLKYKAVWDACLKANIPTPEEVVQFFNGIYPDDSGKMFNLEGASYVRPYWKEGVEGFEIRVDEIPESMKVIRFYNSW